MKAQVLWIGHLGQQGEPVAWAFFAPPLPHLWPGDEMYQRESRDDSGNTLYYGWSVYELREIWCCVRAN